MSELLACLQRSLPPLGDGGRLWVGYSGGRDSSLLLSMVSEYARTADLDVGAIHVHHGLSPHADDWVSHCRKTCATLGVELHVERIALVRDGHGVEAAAREARYRVFARIVQPRDVLILAHHGDDQAETVLLRLLRGAGIDGLAAMQVDSTRRGIRLVRPWLDVPGAQLASEAQIRGLAWIEDESNTDLRFDRNRLRHAVLPSIAARWPEVSRHLGRLARHARETSGLLGELAEIDLQGRLAPDGGLRVAPALSAPRLANLVRHWCRGVGLPLPTEVALRRLCTEVIPAGPDSMPLVTWNGAELRRYRDRLYLMPPLPNVPDGSLPCPMPEEGACGIAGGAFRWQRSTGPAGLPARLVHGGGLALRWRKGGEVLRLPGRRERSLSRWFQDIGLPPWWRERVPLVFLGERLVAVPGLGVADDLAGAPGEETLCPVWTHGVPGGVSRGL